MLLSSALLLSGLSGCTLADGRNPAVLLRKETGNTAKPVPQTSDPLTVSPAAGPEEGKQAQATNPGASIEKRVPEDATGKRLAPVPPLSPPGQAVSSRAQATVVKPMRLPSREKSPQGDYRIGEEDELEISVYGDRDLVKTQTVRPGGKISFPLVGDIKADGLTPDELREQITQSLARYMKNPRVTVIVTKYASRKVSVLGEVKSPGLLRLSSDIDLFEALSRAGGVTEDADLQGAVLLRDREIVAADFEKLLRYGDANQNVPIRPNDVILIPSAKDKKVSVLGEVSKPLVVTLKGDVALMEAISRAGGVTEDADLRGALLLREGQVVPVDFEKLLRHGDASQNVLLRPNDVVLIPNVKDKKVFVLGQVSKPLVVSLKGDVGLFEAISRAGGVTEDADLRGALLLREGQVVPVSFEKLLRHGDASQNVLLRPNDVVLIPNVKDKKVFVLGEVNKPAVVTLKGDMSLVESISIAGGFTRDAASKNVLLIRGGLGDPKLITVNVNEITGKGEVVHNAALEPGDIVYVPKTLMANVVRFFQDIASILTPFVLAESGIVLGPSVQAVLTGKAAVGTTQTQPGVVVGR